MQEELTAIEHLSLIGDEYPRDTMMADCVTLHAFKNKDMTFEEALKKYNISRRTYIREVKKDFKESGWKLPYIPEEFFK